MMLGRVAFSANFFSTMPLASSPSLSPHQFLLPPLPSSLPFFSSGAKYVQGALNWGTASGTRTRRGPTVARLGGSLIGRGISSGITLLGVRFPSSSLVFVLCGADDGVRCRPAGGLYARAEAVVADAAGEFRGPGDGRVRLLLHPFFLSQPDE
ncbi:hypothetical protein B0H11DRAFT_580932 [Mycena galericulata]|nr:hypothetical protein B0H11DRAFT_580932 [Mycena galericulata]